MSAQAPANPSALLLEAIALRKCVEATYNRMVVKLAPHILYTRHDELYVDAVTLERDGQPPREKKIGTFKLDGLRALGFAGNPFHPEPIFDPAAEKYRGVTLFAVDAAPANA
ncbi:MULTISPECIES: WYL domain-containing protein [unclassified Sphingomonas]|uniref:WYL domain-containing protein n=1 Tax=unclassified Sphingomonas TaxID=196159 RepID=UPI001F5828B0|nr:MULTISPECIES: WYL domain-containing protein [unclassified Sphingomonas]